ncbi:hypothetical protein QQF64_007661 [Cirrhinus molitorella]|uniref:Uncharacterized protein n=1 Tax=Cirrhinus molitorella TaxID=172907 RepID=A0ABR3MDK5_9TELE
MHQDLQQHVSGLFHTAGSTSGALSDLRFIPSPPSGMRSERIEVQCHPTLHKPSLYSTCPLDCEAPRGENDVIGVWAVLCVEPFRLPVCTSFFVTPRLPRRIRRCFAEQVRLYRHLYDPSMREHRDSQMVQNSWKEIGFKDDFPLNAPLRHKEYSNGERVKYKQQHSAQMRAQTLRRRAVQRTRRV